MAGPHSCLRKPLCCIFTVALLRMPTHLTNTYFYSIVTVILNLGHTLKLLFEGTLKMHIPRPYPRPMKSEWEGTLAQTWAFVKLSEWRITVTRLGPHGGLKVNTRLWFSLTCPSIRVAKIRKRNAMSVAEPKCHEPGGLHFLSLGTLPSWSLISQVRQLNAPTHGAMKTNPLQPQPGARWGHLQRQQPPTQSVFNTALYWLQCLRSWSFLFATLVNSTQHVCLWRREIAIISDY